MDSNNLKVMDELDELIGTYVKKRNCYPECCGCLRFWLKWSLGRVSMKDEELFNEMAEWMREGFERNIKDLNEENKEEKVK